MSTFNYTRSQKTATRLIAKFGNRPNSVLRGAIRRTNPGAGANAWTPGAGVPVDYPAQFVVIDYTLRQRENEAIQQNDRRVLLAPFRPDGTELGIEPKPGDLLVEADANSATVNQPGVPIIEAMPLNPSGQVNVLWDMQVRF